MSAIKINEPTRYHPLGVKATTFGHGEVFTSHDFPLARWVRLSGGCIEFTSQGGGVYTEPAIVTEEQMGDDVFDNCYVLSDCTIACTFGAD